MEALKNKTLEKKEEKIAEKKRSRKLIYEERKLKSKSKEVSKT